MKIYSFNLFLTVLPICLAAVRGAISTYTLPEIKYADLLTLESSAADMAVEVLTSVGALQIVDIPRFGMIRKRALEDLGECFQSEGTAPVLVMPDGSRRVSCGAATHRGLAEPMSNICGEASAKLRATVDATTRQLFLALDAAAAKRPRGNRLMEPGYESFVHLMTEGEHLEHLHTYFSPTSASKLEATSAATLNYHVDAGLMIAMTVGYYNPSEVSEASGLYLELPDGSRSKVLAKEDALIILMGDGAERWLAPVLGKAFRAPPHALLADLPAESGASRSWYGKMYLPPVDAIIPQEGISFASYHELEAKKSAPLTTAEASTADQLSALLPSACGGHLGLWGEQKNKKRYLSTVGNSCPSGEIWCWARCMDASTLPCGSDAVCWNNKDNEPMDPNQMCMGGDDDTTNGIYCGPKCVSTPSNSSSSGYCYGEGTSMFMQGFVSIVQEGEGNTECVNLLFTDWTLDSRTKYAFGCLGVFFMCVLIQFISSLRPHVNKLSGLPPWAGKGLHLLLYSVHVTLGYFAMLVAMTYSVELFCMVCSGLIAGFALFHLSDPLAAKSTDPCCGEVEDDKVKQEKEGGGDLTNPLIVNESCCCDAT
eukprot:gene8457-9323_t